MPYIFFLPIIFIWYLLSQTELLRIRGLRVFRILLLSLLDSRLDCRVGLGLIYGNLEVIVIYD